MSPPGFVHVDLDGLWTLAGAYGYSEGNGFNEDIVFDIGVPRLLDLLAETNIRATFFVIGRDLENAGKRQRIRTIAEAGHQLANHTYNHRFDLELLQEEDLQQEISRTSDAIEEVCGRRPLGFRAPGYGAGPRVLEACGRAGLRYDGSYLPTRWSFLLRWMAGRLRRRIQNHQGEAQQFVAGAELQYGGLDTPVGSDPLAPFWYAPPGCGERMLRLPLSVSPGLRLPLHASLGILLGTKCVCAGLQSLALRGHPVTYLLHGLDVIGREDLIGRVPSVLLNQRGFNFSFSERLDFLKRAFDQLRKTTEIQITEDWLQATPNSIQ